MQSMEFSWPKYWSGYSPGDLPNPGIEPRSPTLQADSLPAEPQEKPNSKTNSITLASGYFNNDSICHLSIFFKTGSQTITHWSLETHKSAMRFIVYLFYMISCRLQLELLLIRSNFFLNYMMYLLI